MRRLPLIVFLSGMILLSGLKSESFAQKATPTSYFSSPKGEKLYETLEDINKSFLPYGAGLKNDKKQVNSNQVSGLETGAEDDPVVAPAAQYSIGTSVQTQEKSSTGISFILKDFFAELLGIFGFGNKKATQFSEIQVPLGVAKKELAGSENVLDSLFSDTAMEKSLSLRQRQNLPLSVGLGVKEEYGEEPPPNPPSCGGGGGGGDGGGGGGGSGGGVGSGICPLGVGYCAPEYLSKFFLDPLKTKQASVICQQESGSQPGSINLGCLKPDPAERTKEYSVGLFQINLWFDTRCEAGATLSNKVEPAPYACKEGPYFDTCTDQFKDPDFNIDFARVMSVVGTNWKPWSAATYCGIIDKTVIAEDICTAPVDNCPDESQVIKIPNSSYQLLDYRGGCIKPTMIVIHWSGAWTDVYATFNTLNQRQLACQLATDKNITLQSQNFYKDQVQRGACVGGYNDFVLNNEITGSYFDDVYDVPNHPNYKTLEITTEKALASTCFMMKQYNIPITQIFGHFQLNDGKSDPGANYLNDFIDNIQKKIDNGTCI